MHLDPTIINSARRIYRAYLNIYARIPKKPRGVVLNAETFRGQLVFREKPILLPGECFIPLQHLEAKML